MDLRDHFRSLHHVQRHAALRARALERARVLGSRWYVYLVRCRDGTLYTGVTNDLTGRIALHNAGRGAKYTRSRLPVTLVYRERAEGRAAAQKREHEIKGLPRAAKIALCARARGASRTTRAR